jgi:hypothetical protein
MLDFARGAPLGQVTKRIGNNVPGTKYFMPRFSLASGWL